MDNKILKQLLTIDYAKAIGYCCKIQKRSYVNFTVLSEDQVYKRMR